MWGKVRFVDMKFPMVLQAPSGIQAYRAGLRVLCTDRDIGTWKAPDVEWIRTMKH